MISQFLALARDSGYDLRHRADGHQATQPEIAGLLNDYAARLEAADRRQEEAA